MGSSFKNVYLKSFTVADLVLFSMKCAKKFRYPADNITNKNKEVIDVYFRLTCVRYLCLNFSIYNRLDTSFEFVEEVHIVK